MPSDVDIDMSDMAGSDDKILKLTIKLTSLVQHYKSSTSTTQAQFAAIAKQQEDYQSAQRLHQETQRVAMDALYEQLRKITESLQAKVERHSDEIHKIAEKNNPTIKLKSAEKPYTLTTLCIDCGRKAGEHLLTGLFIGVAIYGIAGFLGLDLSRLNS